MIAVAAVVLLILRPWQGATPQPGYGFVAGGGKFVAHWFVDPTSYIPGEVLIDGVLQSKDLTSAELSARVAQAKTVGTEGSNLRIQYGDWFVIAMDADSTLDITELPAGPGTGDFTLAASGGGYQVRTGAAFKSENCKLRVRTPQTEVDVVGTVFGINCLDAGTCVCCTEGSVKVMPLAQAHGPHEVLADTMSFVHTDESVPSLGGTYPDHVPALRALEAYEFKTCPR